MGEYMGTTASRCKQDKMYQASSFLLLASCLSNVFCQTARPPYPPGGPPPPPAQYPTPSPVQDYNPDIGQTNVGGYGVNKDPYCHKVEKVIFKNKCEPYKEKTCWTQNEEICSPVMYKNCTGVIETNIESGEKDITLKDFYSLDTNKNDSWNVIIESDQVMEWFGETDDDEDDEDEDDEEDDESGMDTD